MKSFAPLSSLRCGGLALALFCAALLTTPGAHAASALAELIMEAQTKDEFNPRKVAAVYRETVLRGEGIDRVVLRLEAFSRQPGLSDQARARLHLAAAHLQWRDGRIGPALASSSRAMELAPDADTLLLQARLLDAGGESERARDLYVRAAEASGEGEEQWLIRTRLAMMDANRIDVEALEKLALRRDPQFRNQAAVVVALLGRPERAIKLYEPRAEDGSLYPQHLRLAEWALMAREHGLAREQAWLAYAGAEVRLDRRYALALLSESYRETGELDRLLGELALRGVGDEEILRLRVETLIETKEYEQAIELYRELEGSEAEIHQRSRLVSLYEAAGDSDGMVREYERMMLEEPDRVQWYDGLAAHYLYRAEPARALQVWQELEERNAERAGVLVEAARLMLQTGFTSESMAMIERHMQAHGPSVSGLLFLFEARLVQGQENEALDVLSRLDGFLPASAAERRELADAYERTSRPQEAVRVFEDMRDSEGGLGHDEQVRLAWLYANLGRKQDALRQWQQIWLGVESPARRFFVEEQMLSLAAELGALGNMALELEEKLNKGTGSRHHLILLVRIYSEVGDRLSATEAIGEYAVELVENEIVREELLARANLELEDYSAHDKALRRLYKLGAADRVDIVRSILINLLTFDLVEGSRQRIEEINRWIGELRKYDAEASGADFEAEIYARAGLGELALDSYRRALVSEPEDSDNLLRMADLLKNQGRVDEALAILQYVAEHAIEDNDLVVAVDGIINMLGTSGHSEQSDPDSIWRLDWTRRAIMERIAASTNSFYYYELLADIGREKRETEVTFRALENSLAEAGIRRPAILRELLTMSTPSAGFAGFDTGVGDFRRQLKYGRRLVGLRLRWPPDVYTGIGKSLLNTGDLSGAERAFEMIDDITGLIDVHRTKAEILEEGGYEHEALRHYNRALNVNRNSLELLHKTGFLSEAQGKNDVAFRRYLAAMQGLLRQQATELPHEPPDVDPDPFQTIVTPGTDTTVTQEFREYYPSLEQGLLLSWPNDGEESATAMEDLKALFEEELGNVLERSRGDLLALSRYVRLDRAARLIRRVGFFLNDSEIAKYADLRLLEHFEDDLEFERQLRKQYGQAGQQLYEIGERSTDARSPGKDSSLPESLLRRQLALAVERKDFHTQLELLRLEGANDEIKALLIERVLDGHYREGLGYAWAFLEEREFKSLVLSVAPKLIEDRTALLKFLGLDFELYVQIEEIAGRPLVPDGKVLDLLMSPQAWELTEDRYSDTLGYWEYLMARSGMDHRLRYLQALVERSDGDRTIFQLELGAIIPELLREELSDRQRRDIADLLVEYLSKLDKNYQDVRYTLDPFCFLADIHSENLQVLYRVLDYMAMRWPETPKTRPMLKAFYEQRFDDAFRQYATLMEQTTDPSFSFIHNRELFEGLAGTRSAILDALLAGRPVDRKLTRAAYAMEFPLWREFDLTDKELKRKADLLDQLRKLDPVQESYRQDLIHVWLRLGEIQRAGEAIALEYRTAPENEAWRLAYFLFLLSEQEFSEALALTRDGGTDYSDTRILQQSLLSHMFVRQMSFNGEIIRHLQSISGWSPAAMHNINIPGLDTQENAAQQRLREAVLDSNHSKGRNALRESWRTLMAPSNVPYEPLPGATPLQLHADDLLSTPIEDPAKSAGAKSNWLSRNFKRLVVIPHMPADQIMTPAHTTGDDTLSRRPLFHAVAESPYGASELNAYLRAAPDEHRRSFFRLYEFLARAYLTSGNRDIFGDLSSRVTKGDMDDHDFTLWMLLRDQLKLEFDAVALKAFERRLNELADPASYQLLLAARLFAASGSLDKAVQYYKLVVARRIQHGEYSQTTREMVTSVTNADAFGDLTALMEEVAEQLPAQQARKVIDAAFELSRWGDDVRGAELLPHAFLLSSLDKVHSPDKLLAEAGGWSPAVLKRPEILLGAGAHKAIELVRIYARSGKVRRAVELLGEILKRPAGSEHRQIQWEYTRQEAESSAATQALSDLYGLEVIDQETKPDPKNAGVRELMSRKERILPQPDEDWSNAEEWIAVLADELLGWMEEDELSPEQVIPVFVAAVMSPTGRGPSPGEAQRLSVWLQELVTAIDDSPQPIGVAGLTSLAPLAQAAGKPIPLEWLARVLINDPVSRQDRLVLLRTQAGTELEASTLTLFRRAGLDFGLDVPRQLLAMAESVGDDAYAADLRERVSLEEAARAALQPSEQG